MNTAGTSIEGSAATPSSMYAIAPARVSPAASSDVPIGGE